MRCLKSAFFLFFSLFASWKATLLAQHTFSIVAVDPSTGEVGGAGATCLSLDREGYQALIISHVQPGVGAVHTQSYWNALNQYNGAIKLEERLSAQDLILWLTENDAEQNPSIRQYGAAVLSPQGDPSAAGYTGSNCLNAKKHVSGLNYSIQGNILLGGYVVDSMEARFLRSTGSLADRLMEAMRGALIPGADSRCLREGLSSRSSFIRVARPQDTLTGPSLDISVGSVRPGLDPIDSLLTRYQEWKKLTAAEPPPAGEEKSLQVQIRDGFLTISGGIAENPDQLTLSSLNGFQYPLVETSAGSRLYTLPDQLIHGVYILSVRSGSHIRSQKIVLGRSH